MNTTTMRTFTILLLVSVALTLSHAFVAIPQASTRTPTGRLATTTMQAAASTSDDEYNDGKQETATATTTTVMEDLSAAAKEVWQDIRDAPERYRLQQDIILHGASFDRGFGASPSARQKADDMIRRLTALQDKKDDLTANIKDGKGAKEEDAASPSPLQGVWRLVWTTAQNILVLNGSPFSTVGAIYLVVEPPVVTSIIDFVPRYESLFPTNRLPHTLTRAKTKSTATAVDRRTLRLQQESVNVKPIDILGRKTGSAVPALNLKVPKLPGARDSDDSQRALRVLYADHRMLIVEQDAPGGINVLVKVDNAEP